MSVLFVLRPLGSTVVGGGGAVAARWFGAHGVDVEVGARIRAASGAAFGTLLASDARETVLMVQHEVRF